jgi:hypothetical protein
VKKTLTLYLAKIFNFIEEITVFYEVITHLSPKSGLVIRRLIFNPQKFSLKINMTVKSSKKGALNF